MAEAARSNRMISQDFYRLLAFSHRELPARVRWAMMLWSVSSAMK
jgi:hypothetical protein